MRRRRVDSGLERQYLIAMITSKPFLASAAQAIEFDLIDTAYVRQVMTWCVEHYLKYGEPPDSSIQSIFHAWVEEEERDEAEVEAIEAFLTRLSEEYDEAKLNVPFLLDSFGSYLQGKKLDRLSDRVSGYMLRGDQEAAMREVTDFSSVSLGQGTGFDPLTDRSAWERAFSSPAEPIVTFPGDAGRFLNKALTRDALIAIQGHEKSGKTFWCVEFMMRALRNHMKVALFETGDLSESQIMLRLGVRLSSMPLYSDQCGTIDIPRRVIRADDQEEEGLAVEIETTSKDCPRSVSRRECWKACRRLLRSIGAKRGEPRVMFSIHPSSSINVTGIEGILNMWQNEKGFVPDVIIIDYADILAPEPGSKEFRHQQNDLWKALRRVSQERHSLVIVPTQANARSYDAATQSMKNFSEDKRKMAHVTGMLGLNQTSKEKDAGLIRLNWIVLRESSFVNERCLHVAQCLPLGRAFCCATL